MMTFCFGVYIVHQSTSWEKGVTKNNFQFRGRTGIALKETRTTAKRFKVEKQLQKKQKFHRVNTGFGTGVKQRGSEHNNLTDLVQDL